jgi:hypothetical protein
VQPERRQACQATVKWVRIRPALLTRDICGAVFQRHDSSWIASYPAMFWLLRSSLYRRTGWVETWLFPSPVRYRLSYAIHKLRQLSIFSVNHLPVPTR